MSDRGVSEQPSQRAWERSAAWRQVAQNTTRRAEFGKCTRGQPNRDERRWNGVSKP